jgi:probable phosphoglycerate mutase
MGRPVPGLTWLVRHGESTANAGATGVWHADTPLTELGIAQSRAVAAQIGQRPDLVVSSGFLRARQTADIVCEAWPGVERTVWSIEEITYLDPGLCVGTTPATRKPMIEDYWDRADPAFRHGPDAETFTEFAERVAACLRRLSAEPADKIVIVGHGQFFRALQLAADGALDGTQSAMLHFREHETSRPMRNGEVIRIGGGDFA